MSSRTTSEKVQKILLDHYGPSLSGKSPDLQPFIDTATVIVTDVATCATAKSATLSADRLELIERWLAGHYYAIADPSYESRSTGGASGKFRGKTEMYLESTLFGQMALSLDPTGCLAKIAGGAKVTQVKVAWLGKPKSTQTEYEDRD